MFGFFIRRTLWIIPVLLTVALVTFFLMHRAPGGPWDTSKPLVIFLDTTDLKDFKNVRFLIDSTKIKKPATIF